VLKEGGFDAHKAAALMQDVESIMAGQWHVEPLAKVAWMRRVEAAIGDICHFPKSEILVLARDFGNWVADVYKKYNIATGSSSPEPTLCSPPRSRTVHRHQVFQADCLPVHWCLGRWKW